jgi:transporter family-2 protein
MQASFYIFLSLLMGAMLSIYLPMNSAVSKHLGSPITANISFFFVALIASIFIFAFWGEFDTIKRIKEVPLWLYLTGVVSAFMILGTTFLIPKLGVRKFFILTISGQILMAIIVSHFGFLGTPKDLISIKKIIGAIFIVFGVIFSIL